MHQFENSWKIPVCCMQNSLNVIVDSHYYLNETVLLSIQNTCLNWWVKRYLQFYLWYYNKTCVKWPLSKWPKIGFQNQLSLYAGQKYCRTLQGEHSAILSTSIKLPFVIKIFVLSIYSGRFTKVLLYWKSLYCHQVFYYPWLALNDFI